VPRPGATGEGDSVSRSGDLVMWRSGDWRTRFPASLNLARVRLIFRGIVGSIHRQAPKSAKGRQKRLMGTDPNRPGRLNPDLAFHGAFPMPLVSLASFFALLAAWR